SIEEEVTPIPEKKRQSRVLKKERLETLQKIKAHSQGNEIEIVKSTDCGCFFCRGIFSARDVQEWIDDEEGVTALCPECGMDAVVGDASGYPISKELMKEMNLAFFGMNEIDNDPKAAETYVSRYLNGKISHKEKSEALYIHYLTVLEGRGDPIASLALGNMYRYGTEFTIRDPEEALFHFSKPSLYADPDALNSIGDLLLARQSEPDDTKRAYECFVKATALGNLSSIYRLVDCYSKGLAVKHDRKFAYATLKTALFDAFQQFGSTKESWYDFPEFTSRMASCFDLGIGVQPDDEMALKYYLITEFACNLRLAFYGYDHNPALLKKAQQRIEEIGKAHSLVRGAPVYDIDTFEDSFDEQFLHHETYSVTSLEFDEDEHELVMRVSYPGFTLITDIGNLNCGFVSGEVEWRFKDVVSYRSGNELNFNRVDGDYDSGYRFVMATPEGEVPVLEIQFMPDSDSRFELKIQEK
ncbi:MAG: sel1 repeat family protein, partial [Bacilli bacterium]|nr:sel1 repeat family protein [Bacilli bacterium]